MTAKTDGKVEEPQDLDGLLRWLSMYGKVTVSDDVLTFRDSHAVMVTLDYERPITLFDLKHILERVEAVRDKRQKGHPHVILYAPFELPELSSDEDQHGQQYGEVLRQCAIHSSANALERPFPLVRGGILSEDNVPFGIYGIQFVLQQHEPGELRKYYPNAPILQDTIDGLRRQEIVNLNN